MELSIRDTTGQDLVLTPPKWHWRPWLYGAVGLLGAGVLWLFVASWLTQLSTDRSIPRSDIRTALVTRGDVRRELAAEGKLVVANSPTLYSSAEGIITYRYKAGDAVNTGDLLLTIESPSLSSELAQAEATLDRLLAELNAQQLGARQITITDHQTEEKIQLELTAAERNFERFRQGYEKQFISRWDFEKAEDQLRLAKLTAGQWPQTRKLNEEVAHTRIENARLQVQSQQAVVDELKRRTAALQVFSPVTGQVGALAHKQKAVVSQFSPLITVVDLSRFEVEVSVPESYAADLQPQMPVEIQLDGQKHPAELTAIAPEVTGGQLTLRLGFTGEPPARLRQNQRVSSRILLEQKQNVLRLPKGIYLDADQGRSLFRVRGDIAERVPVKLGAQGLLEVEVLDGLEQGDEVIISDTADLRSLNRIFLSN
jgi:HlyD family secretion protein